MADSPGNPSQMSPAWQREQLHRRIDNDFTNHAPNDPTTVPRYLALRKKASELAYLIIDVTPPSREQSLALTNLEQALMYAVAAIARHEHEAPEMNAALEDHVTKLGDAFTAQHSTQ